MSVSMCLNALSTIKTVSSPRITKNTHDFSETPHNKIDSP